MSVWVKVLFPLPTFSQVSTGQTKGLSPQAFSCPEVLA